MSGIFNGSAYLWTANHLVGSTPTYPVLIGGWANINNLTSQLSGAAIGDNQNGYVNGIVIDERKPTTTNLVRTTIIASGGVSIADAGSGSISSDVWFWYGTVLRSASDRSAIFNASIGTPQTTNRAVSNLSQASLGAYRHGSVTEAFHSGSLAEWTFASGFAIGDLQTIVNQLAAGARPPGIPQLSNYINAYQPLRRGLNDHGYIGPDWTNTNVTFDSADHPRVHSPGAFNSPIFNFPTLLAGI